MRYRRSEESIRGNYLKRCECGECGILIWHLDNHWHIRKYVAGHQNAGKHLGEENTSWKGDKVGKAALHDYVRRYLPEPELCQMCNKVPPYDLANVTGIYNRDFKNWKYVCRKCHGILDKKGKKLKPETVEKMRKSQSGKNNGMYGKHFSEETKQKMRQLRLEWWRKKNEILKPTT